MFGAVNKPLAQPYGFPVSVTAANLVMEDVEKRALSTYPLPLPFWKCYVDDTLTALPLDKVQHFHQHLNSIETTIQFTVEMESESTLSFLDTRIAHHSDGSLSTTVFRKSTHTDKYLDFQSHHPMVLTRCEIGICQSLFSTIYGCTKKAGECPLIVFRGGGAQTKWRSGYAYGMPSVAKLR